MNCFISHQIQIFQLAQLTEENKNLQEEQTRVTESSKDSKQKDVDLKKYQKKCTEMRDSIQKLEKQNTLLKSQNANQAKQELQKVEQEKSKMEKKMEQLKKEIAVLSEQVRRDVLVRTWPGFKIGQKMLTIEPCFEKMCHFTDVRLFAGSIKPLKYGLYVDYLDCRQK